MREITKMLVTGGLALSLLLTGCNQGGGDTKGDARGTEKETVTQSSTDDMDKGEATTTAPSGETTKSDTQEATIKDLNGWWKVATFETTAMEESFDETRIDDYVDLFHSPSVFKVNSDDGTFEMNAFCILLSGTIESQPVDGWFVLNADWGSGLFNGLQSAKCRLTKNGEIELQVVNDMSGEQITTSYTAKKDSSLDGKSVTDSVLDYAVSAYMDFRNDSMNLPINWYEEPTVLAENSSCKLFLLGTGETDDSYLLMTGVSNENDFPVLVANFYTGTTLTANGNVSIEPIFGCYMFGWDGDEQDVRIYGCPIYIPKSSVPNGLSSVSGSLDITDIALGDYGTLDFNINL